MAFASCVVIQRSDGGNNLCSENNLVKIRDNFLGSKMSRLGGGANSRDGEAIAPPVLMLKKALRALHWDILRQRGFKISDKWYQHQPERVVENEQFKVLWDFTIQRDIEKHARRPDIVIVDKNSNETIILDVAMPVDVNIRNKEQEKIVKYQDLAREIRKIWNVSTKVIPIVIGALGTVTDRLEHYLKDIGVTTRIELIQKSTLLGTARIIRPVLDV